MSSQEKRIRPIILLLIFFALPNVLFLLSYIMGRQGLFEEANEEPLIIKKAAVLIVVNIEEVKKLKTVTMESFEEDLKKRIKDSKAGEFNNKICDQKECTFSVVGLEADRLQQVIKPVLKKLPVNSGYLNMVYDLKNSQDRIKKDLY